MDIDDGFDTGGSVGQTPRRKTPEYAFPLDYSTLANKGLTVQDYFAAAAVIGLCACSNFNSSEIPKMAYTIANDMMEERKKYA